MVASGRRESADPFLAFHAQIENLVKVDSRVSTVDSDEFGVRSFSVMPADSGLAILVFERNLVSQSEWDARRDSFDRIMERHATKSEESAQVDVDLAHRMVQGLEAIGNLPEWHYRGRVGLDVSAEEPEAVYPEMNAHIARSRAVYRRIVEELTAYDAKGCGG